VPIVVPSGPGASSIPRLPVDLAPMVRAKDVQVRSRALFQECATSLN
jgi:hypothetical protein